MIEATNVTVRYGGAAAVRGVSFRADAGEWLMVVGPNGAGKSSLLAALARCAPYEGEVALEGKDARLWKPRAYARRVGMLAQLNRAEYAFTVEEVVRMGRYAHRGGFLSDAGERESVDTALARTGLTSLRGRSMLTLSGGELQRVFLAQVFAQEPGLLLLDEPANHLDLVYQKQIFDMIQEWLAAGGRAVISVVHDLSLALNYGTRALLMADGELLRDGTPARVLGGAAASEAYGMDIPAWMNSLLSAWKPLQHTKNTV